MAQDVTKETLEEIHESLGGALTAEEIKDILYSAYSYSTAIGDHNINNPASLLQKIDWDYYIKQKQEK